MVNICAVFHWKICDTTINPIIRVAKAQGVRIPTQDNSTTFCLNFLLKFDWNLKIHGRLSHQTHSASKYSHIDDFGSRTGSSESFPVCRLWQLWAAKSAIGSFPMMKVPSCMQSDVAPSLKSLYIISISTSCIGYQNVWCQMLYPRLLVVLALLVVDELFRWLWYP